MQIAERRALVVQLRVAGGSLRSIAATLRALPAEDRQKYGVTDKYSEGHVHADLREEMSRLIAQATEGVEELRRLELERLDALWAAWWERATEQLDPTAFDRLMSIMDRRARLLGLNAPARAELTGRDGQPIAFKTYIGISPDDWDKISADSTVPAPALADRAVA